jgi:hypothetical protein
MSMTVDDLPLFPKPDQPQAQDHRARHGHNYKPGHRPNHCGAMVLDIDGYGRDCGEKP